MRTKIPFAAIAILSVMFVLASSTGRALAHERRQVDKYIFVVGWFVEPAFVQEKNGVDVHVSTGTLPAEDAPASGAQAAEPPPVEGLEKTLKVEVIYGAQRRTVDLRRVFRQPGRYTADLIPTRVGDYRFRFIGTVEQTSVDETFDSADRKFNAVQAVEGIQFPQNIPGPEVLSNQTGSARTLATSGVVLGALGVLLGAAALRGRGRSGGRV